MESADNFDAGIRLIGRLFPRDLHEVCERLDVYVVEQIAHQEKQKMLA